MNTEYYFENSNTICLNKYSEKLLEIQLQDLRCRNCGKEIHIVTFQEESNVVCKENPWSHKTGYRIDCGDFTKEPKVVIDRNQFC